MKVVHVNTNQKGGAGIACRRLHEGLLKAGVDSQVLVLNIEEPAARYHAFLDHKWSRIERLKFSIFFRLYSIFNNLIKATLKEFEVISIPLSPYDITKHPEVKSADVVHLHWVGNFVDYRSFFKKIRKPVIWTLHDTNPIGGIFHYPIDERRNNNIIGLDRMVMKLKSNYLFKCENLSFVYLCHWMKDQINNRSYGNFPNFHIPNGIEESVFRPIDQRAARKQFNLPVHKKVVLFVADNLSNERKGFRFIEEAVNRIKDESIVWCAIGETPNNQPGINYLGTINDERVLANAYSSANLFVIPSLEDNLPNTVLEAMFCGIPALGFKVGGLPDMIDNEINGLLLDKIDIDQLCKKIVELLQEQTRLMKLGLNARKKATSNFDISNTVKKYQDLYLNVIP